MPTRFPTIGMIFDTERDYLVDSCRYGIVQGLVLEAPGQRRDLLMLQEQGIGI